MRTRQRVIRLLVTTALVASGLVALAGSASAFNDQVSVLDFRYDSDDLTVTEGDTVVFRWDGQDTHTVSAFDESFESGVKYPGDDFAVTFEEPGSYAYFCRIHGPDMSGVVNVMPAEGKAVTPKSADNVATAIAWSEATVPDGGASTVLLSRDNTFPDALASGGPQGSLGAPLLLNPTGALDDRVKAELARVGAGEVVVLGGEVAISAAVVTALEAEGYVVTRIGGADRVDTAANVASRYFPTSDEALLARSRGPGSAGFADSIGAGAAAAKAGMPVLLTPTDSLAAATKSYLTDAGVTTVHIAGGLVAISQAVQDELEAMGIAVNRFAGEDRWDTNGQIGAHFSGGFFDPDFVVSVVNATRDDTEAWATGLAAALSVADKGMLVVANGAEVNAHYLETLIELDPAVICGPGTADACGWVVNAAGTPSFVDAGNLLAVANMSSGGDADGQRAWLDLRPADDDGTACWATVNGSLMTPVADSHIHKVSDNTAVFSTGAITPGASPNYGCGTEANAGDLAAILATPSNYYWNIHFADTSETVKGTVTKSSEVGFTFGEGSQVTGGGHPTGVTFSPHWFDANADDVFCIAIQAFIFGADGPEPVTAAHIHPGGQGEDGAPVIALEPPPAGNLVGGGCVDTDNAGLLADIRANPNDYYLQLHTAADTGAGAVRGQLIDIMPPHSAPVVVS